MNHRTRVIRTSNGHVGICSCGYVTTADGYTQAEAAVEIADHEVTALRKGVKVTHLDPAQLELPARRPK